MTFCLSLSFVYLFSMIPNMTVFKDTEVLVHMAALGDTIISGNGLKFCCGWWGGVLTPQPSFDWL